MKIFTRLTDVFTESISKVTIVSVAIIFMFASGVLAATITSVADGNWSASGTWDNGVPQAGDDVIIASGTTVTLDVSSAALNSLDIRGTLDVNGHLLDVNGNVTVSGTLEDLTYATSRNVTISGNLDVSGTLTYVSVKFDGTTSKTLSGSGTITFYNVEFSSGTFTNTSGSQDFSELFVTGATFQPSNTWKTSVTGTSATIISIQSGTFSPQSSCTFSLNAVYDPPPPPVNAATLIISNTSTASTITFNNIDFQSDNTNNVLEFSDNSGSTAYQINGTLNFTGTAKGAVTLTNSTLTYGSSGTLKYSVGGTVDADEWPSTGAPNVVLQSGAVTIPSGVTCEVDNKLTQINGSISVSGTLRYDNANTTTLEYAPSPAADVTVGDEWPTGSTTRPSNVTVNNSGKTVTVSATDRVIPKTLNIVAGTLAMGSNNLTVLGSIASSDIAGSGSVTSTGSINVGDGTTQLAQTISGSVTLDNLTVNKGGSGTANDLTISGSPTITNNFTVTNGDVIADGTVTISSGALILSNSSTFTVRNGALSTATLTLNGTSTFTTGGKSVSGLSTLTTASGSTFEFNGTSLETTPSGATFGNVNMNNTAGLNISGTVTVNGTLTFNQNATVNTSSSNILVISTSGSISGTAAARYVKGPLRKQFTSTGSFTFPVGTSALRSAVFNYTAGTFGGTSVIEIEHSTASFTEGTRPNGISAIDQSSHYILRERGTAPTSFTYSFTGTFEDGNFSPETRNRVLVQASATPTWTVGTTNPSTDINTTDNTVLASGFTALPSDSPYLVTFGSATTAVTWDGGGADNNWSTAANWVGDVVPQTGDAVLLDNSALAQNYTVIYDAGVTQTSFASIHISSDATHSISLTMDKSATVDLTATSDAINVGSSDKLIYSGSSITMNGSAYDPSLTTYSGEVEYQSGSSVYGDAYGGNLVINGASGTSGTTAITVSGNLTKQSSTAFSTSLAFTVTGNYTNTLGNATYSGGLTFNGTTFTVDAGTIGGTVTFSGSAAQAIAGSGSADISIGNLTLNNSNGLTLNHSVIIAGTLTLSAGLINTTTTNLLTIGSSGSISGYSSARYINGPLAHVGTGSKYYPIGNSGDYRPVELVNLAGTDPVIRFEMISSNPGGTTDATLDHISAARYWVGTLTSGSISGCQVRLSWGSSDNVDGSLDDLAVATSATQSGTYTSAGNGGTSGNSSSGTVISNTVSTMQYFTLGSQNGDNSLPVELVSFEAQADYGKVALSWTTASELNNQGFNVYRTSMDNPDAWQQINDELIAGQGTYSSESNYSFVDNNVVAGLNYRYKLESVNVNGLRVEEKTIQVSIPVPTEYTLFNNYPNPFNPTTHLRFQLPERQTVKMAIYDLTGSLVKVLINNQNFDAGEHVVSWDATDRFGNKVSSGMYIYRFVAGKYQKLGKMVLLK